MKKLNINRRSFLRSSSTGIKTLVGLPLLECMFSSSSAFADAPGAQPRFFAMYVPNGVIEERWFGSRVNTTRRIQSLNGSALQAFEDLGLKNDISVYRGMTNAAGIDGSQGNTHMVCISSWLTGKGIPNDRAKKHLISLDQEVSEALGSVKVHSLQLAGNSELDRPNNDVYFNPLKNALNWDKNGNLLPLKSELKVEFDRLFSGNNITGGYNRREKLKISVLDDIKAERQALISKLGAADSARMDQYFESLRDIELSLLSLSSSGGECQKPDLNYSTMPNPRNGSRNISIGEHARVAAKIVAQSFACGLTHAVTYCAGGEAAGCEYRDININAHFHNTISHNRSGQFNNWVKIDQFHGDLCANFMLEMKNTPHGAGNLLNGTAVLFGSGLGNGSSHTRTNLALMVGGHFGRWKHGFSHQLTGRNHGELIETLRVEMNLGKRYNLPTVPIS